MTSKSQEAKKDEFRKYLENAGVLELLTKSLVQLYEEPDRPGNAVSYLKNTVGGTSDDKKTIEELRNENSELKAKLAELERSQLALLSKVNEMESKGETAQAETVDSKNSPAPVETNSKPEDAAETEEAAANQVGDVAVDTPAEPPATETPAPAASEPVTEDAPAAPEPVTESAPATEDPAPAAE